MWTFGSFPLLLDRGEDEGKESKFRSITESCERLRCHWCSLVWRVSEAAPKKTPLYDEHVRLGARMVSFAGWLMPVQYTSIVEEHQAVRNNVGIFDISHMGQLIVEGASACEWLNTMLTNNVGKLDLGTGQYTFLLSDRGGIIDDLIVYRIGQQKFFWRSRHSRPAHRRAISRSVWHECRSSAAKFDCRFSIRGDDCLHRAHRLHRRGWDRGFLSSNRRRENLERRARKRQNVRNQAVRSGRARHVAP